MKYYRMIAFTILVLLANMAHAVSIDWWFTNSGQTWSTTDIIVMEASITNTDTDFLDLGLNGPLNYLVLAEGNFPLMFDYPYGYDFELGDSVPGFGNTEILQPGESLDFIFGWFVPQTDIPTGYYEIRRAGIGISIGIDEMVFNSGNLFNATVVPLPAALWLFITGLTGLYGFSRRGN